MSSPFAPKVNALPRKFMLVTDHSVAYNTPMRLEEKIIHALTNRKMTLSTAESCTGGLMTGRLTDIPGCSKALLGGLVLYSNEAKESLLKVPANVLKKHGAVSEEVAVLLARNVRKKFGSDFGIGITGVAGPGGSSRAKPVGLVFIAVHTAHESLCLKCRFPGTRQQVRKQAVRQALELLWEFLDV